MSQVKGLNLPNEQSTRRKEAWFVSPQAVPVELIKRSFSTGHLLTVICRHCRPSDCSPSGIVLEPDVMLVTASDNKVIVTYWEATTRVSGKPIQLLGDTRFVLRAYFLSYAAQQTVRVGLCHLHSSSFKRRQLMK